MKKLLLCSFIFMFVLTLMGCNPKPNDPTTIVQEYYAAMNAHDLDKAMSYLADDAILTVDDSGKTVQGKEENRKLLQWVYDQGSIQWENSGYSEKDGEVRYAQKVIQGSQTIFQISDGLTIVRDGKIIFDGKDRNKPK